MMTVIPTPIGKLTAVATDDGLAALDFAHRDESFAGLGELADGHHPHLHTAAHEVAAYFAGELTVFTVPLDLRGTPFRVRVWRWLGSIPAGEVRTYAQVAEGVGSPRAARAVGAASGANPVAVIVPCHRVVGAGGRLVGYAGGVAQKRRLLEHESAARGGLGGLFRDA